MKLSDFRNENCILTAEQTKSLKGGITCVKGASGTLINVRVTHWSCDNGDDCVTTSVLQNGSWHPVSDVCL